MYLILIAVVGVGPEIVYTYGTSLEGFVEGVLTCNICWGIWRYHLLSNKTKSNLDKGVG